MSAKDKEATSYEEIAKTYSDFYQTVFGSFFIDLMVSRIKDLEIGDNIKILDLGCGHCSISRSIAQGMNVSTVKAVDKSPEMINKAKKKTEGEIEDIFDYKIADAESKMGLELDYDLIMIQSLMCRIDDPSKVLKNAAKAKSSDGLIFLSYLPKYQYAVSDLKHENIDAFQDTLEKSKTTDTAGIPIRVYDASEMKKNIDSTELSINRHYPVISFLNKLEPERRNRLLKDNYDILMEKELEASREKTYEGLREVLILS